MNTIAEKLADIQVETAENLTAIVAAIHKRALVDPHYCETYADLAFSLQSSWPEFPSGSGRQVNFKSLLAEECRRHFVMMSGAHLHFHYVIKTGRREAGGRAKRGMRGGGCCPPLVK